jgi:hypothetical protein
MAPVSIGVASVSAETTCTSRWRCRASCATICARIVSDPWPVSTVPVSSVAVPSSLIFTTAALGLAATVNRSDTTCSDAASAPFHACAPVAFSCQRSAAPPAAARSRTATL